MIANGSVVNGIAVTPYRQWAVCMMEREARGEQINAIAAQFWREALGYPVDMDAKTAIESVKRQKAAA
jgi:hypothetical protein